MSQISNLHSPHLRKVGTNQAMTQNDLQLPPLFSHTHNKQWKMKNTLWSHIIWSYITLRQNPLLRDKENLTSTILCCVIFQIDRTENITRRYLQSPNDGGETICKRNKMVFRGGGGVCRSPSED
jgi:hypothetical protein